VDAGLGSARAQQTRSGVEGAITYREEVSWTHFEQMASGYAGARPPYPSLIFDVLRDEHVIGAGVRVLEVGAGAGLATRELVAAGCEVVAVEPGHDLAALLRQVVPGTSVIVDRLEDVSLPDGSFDSVVAATALHWVDLSIGLPRLHAALRPGGSLAVFRTIFGDGDVRTDFRDQVDRIVARRGGRQRATGPEERPTMEELSAGGWFEGLRTERWRWSVELTTEQVTRLFRTFSNWTDPEVDAVGAAADRCGGRVTEHYQSVLHLLARS